MTTLLVARGGESGKANTPALMDYGERLISLVAGSHQAEVVRLLGEIPAGGDNAALIGRVLEDTLHHRELRMPRVLETILEERHRLVPGMCTSPPLLETFYGRLVGATGLSLLGHKAWDWAYALVVDASVRDGYPFTGEDARSLVGELAERHMHRSLEVCLHPRSSHVFGDVSLALVLYQTMSRARTRPLQESTSTGLWLTLGLLADNISDEDILRHWESLLTASVYGMARLTDRVLDVVSRGTTRIQGRMARACILTLYRRGSYRVFRALLSIGGVRECIREEALAIIGSPYPSTSTLVTRDVLRVLEGSGEVRGSIDTIFRNALSTLRTPGLMEGLVGNQFIRGLLMERYGRGTPRVVSAGWDKIKSIYIIKRDPELCRTIEVTPGACCNGAWGVPIMCCGELEREGVWGYYGRLIPPRGFGTWREFILALEHVRFTQAMDLIEQASGSLDCITSEATPFKDYISMNMVYRLALRASGQRGSLFGRLAMDYDIVFGTIFEYLNRGLHEVYSSARPLPGGLFSD